MHRIGDILKCIERCEDYLIPGEYYTINAFASNRLIYVQEIPYYFFDQNYFENLRIKKELREKKLKRILK